MKKTLFVAALIAISVQARAVELGAALGMRDDYAPNLELSVNAGKWAELVAGAWYDWHHLRYLTQNAYSGYYGEPADRAGLHTSARVLYSGESGARADRSAVWLALGVGAGFESRTGFDDNDVADTWTLVPAIEQVLRLSVRTGAAQEICTEVTFREAWCKPPYDFYRASTSLTLGVGYWFSVWE